jgi:RNA polymerase sigma-70 factor (family 1)
VHFKAQATFDQLVEFNIIFQRLASFKSKGDILKCTLWRRRRIILNKKCFKFEQRFHPGEIISVETKIFFKNNQQEIELKFYLVCTMAIQQDFEETSLLKRLKDNDKNAFLEIYNHYRKPLYTFIIRFVKVPVYAEDILQDTFLKIWEIRARINTGLSFKAYLYRISRNYVYKFLKSLSAEETLQLNVMHHFQPDNNSPELRLQWKQYEEKINEAINQLPPKRQKVFRLCRERHKTYDQVSRELGISANTVKEHMVLAMKSITEYLKTSSGISFAYLALLLWKK